MIDPAPPWEGVHFPPRVYGLGVVAVTLLGAILRVAHLTRPFNRLMAWNEGHYAMIAVNFNRYGLWSQHNELGVDRTFSPGVPWLMWAAMKLFGPSEAALRLPIAIAGVAAIPLVAALARRLTRSEQIALAAAAFTAAAPGLV
ncbi:MAG TPA: glycosyltransferase family 39 protein, partial [bacterium]|nr:glycosyltransferase family 39 protein [bacterium]